jgi:hypothetical protein
MANGDEKTHLCISVTTKSAKTDCDSSSRLYSIRSILTSALCVAGSKYGSLSLLLRTMMVRVVVPVKTGEPTKNIILQYSRCFFFSPKSSFTFNTLIITRFCDTAHTNQSILHKYLFLNKNRSCQYCFNIVSFQNTRHWT